MDIDLLKTIGLKEKEGEVYLALLKAGPSLAHPLAKSTNLLRGSIYDYLDILVDKGFISFVVKAGKKYFQAVEPTRLMENFNEETNKKHEALEMVIPLLKKLQNTSDSKTIVEVFEGKEGIKTVFNRVLKANPKEFLAFGSSGVLYKIMPYYFEHWHKQRIKQKIKLRVLYNDVAESISRVKKGPSLEYSDVRYVPVTHNSISGTIIYDDLVVLNIWSEDNSVAISIKSQKISANYLDYFEVLWKSGKKK